LGDIDLEDHIAEQPQAIPRNRDGAALQGRVDLGEAHTVAIEVKGEIPLAVVLPQAGAIDALTERDEHSLTNGLGILGISSGNRQTQHGRPACPDTRSR
jgi:hypothetical protein